MCPHLQNCVLFRVKFLLLLWIAVIAVLLFLAYLMLRLVRCSEEWEQDYLEDSLAQQIKNEDGGRYVAEEVEDYS